MTDHAEKADTTTGFAHLALNIIDAVGISWTTADASRTGMSD
jgi:hypothetical protein